MNDEVLAQKITSIQRCVARAREELARSGKAFRTEYGAQDAAIECDSWLRYGVLMREKLIELPLGERLKKMVGFRNLAVHQYRELNMDIVEAVIGKGRDDLLEFANAARSLVDSTHS
jgi:hypothetical protein